MKDLAGSRKFIGPSKSCPRCRSAHVHRSHRRSVVDRALRAVGADIRRCHECRFRHASFVSFAVPLGEPRDAARRRTEVRIVASGLLVWLLFVWWIIRRFTELSG